MPEKSTCRGAAQPRCRNGWNAPELPLRSASGARCGFVEEFIDFARRFGIDPGHMFQIGDGGTLDCLQRAEVPQQRALTHRTDAGDFLQAGFADVLLALLPMRADRETMRLIAQPLDEIQHPIARPDPGWRAPRHEESLAPGIALRAFG